MARNGRKSGAYEGNFPFVGGRDGQRRRRGGTTKHEASGGGRSRRPRYEDDFDWDDERDKSDWLLAKTEDDDLAFAEGLDTDEDWEEGDEWEDEEDEEVYWRSPNDR